MLQDGIVNKYLDEHCPDATLQLCQYKNVLPNNADTGSGAAGYSTSSAALPGLGKEMERIAVESLAAYPAAAGGKTAAIATARQLVAVHTGEGVRALGLAHLFHRPRFHAAA